MYKVTLANGDELLIAERPKYSLSKLGYLFRFENGKYFNDDIETVYGEIGTLTVHEDRSLLMEADNNSNHTSGEIAMALQSQLPLVNPVELQSHRDKRGKMHYDVNTLNKFYEAESKLMKPGKYIVIIKTNNP